MIALVAGSVLYLTGLQAIINAPLGAFRTCVREASAKASSEKVGGDAIEAYLRTACSTQIGSLKSALTAFDMKNGMAHKSATSDAESTVADYLSGPVDK